MVWITCDTTLAHRQAILNSLTDWVPEVKATGTKIVIFGVSGAHWNMTPAVRQLVDGVSRVRDIVFARTGKDLVLLSLTDVRKQLCQHFGFQLDALVLDFFLMFFPATRPPPLPPSC